MDFAPTCLVNSLFFSMWDCVSSTSLPLREIGIVETVVNEEVFTMWRVFLRCCIRPTLRLTPMILWNTLHNHSSQMSIGESPMLHSNHYEQTHSTDEQSPHLFKWLYVIYNLQYYICDHPSSIWIPTCLYVKFYGHQCDIVITVKDKQRRIFVITNAHVYANICVSGVSLFPPLLYV